jgi:hypothetical protein
VEEELQPSQVSIVDKVMKDEEGASEGLRDMLIGLAGARGAVRNGRYIFGGRGRLFGKWEKGCTKRDDRSAEMDKRDQEDEGLRIGLRYIETVLDYLDRISL